MPNNLSENKVDDVIINCFLTLNMIDIQSFEYSEPISHLGITGRLILDCYTGKCSKHEYDYDSENNLIHHQYDVIDYSCSKQCSYNGKEECLCNSLDNEFGKCSRIYDDIYAN